MVPVDVFLYASRTLEPAPDLDSVVWAIDRGHVVSKPNEYNSTVGFSVYGSGARNVALLAHCGCPSAQVLGGTGSRFAHDATDSNQVVLLSPV